MADALKANLSQSALAEKGLVVGLDARPLEAGFKAHAARGTGRYVRELIKHLTQAEFPGVEKFISLGSKEITGPSAKFVSYLPFGKTTVSSQLLLPATLSRFNLSLMHFFSHGDAPAHGLFPFVVTVLDLIPLRFPELYATESFGLKFRFARALEDRAIRAAKGILAISEQTKKDIIELKGIPAEKIFVTPLAVSENFKPQTDVTPKISAVFRLLHVGGIDPRKNVHFLLEVFSEVNKIMPQTELVLAGPYEGDKHFPALKKKIETLGLTRSVKLLGFAPESELVSLYHSADLVVFPSLYEGFGFPVLEALSCGVAVVAGNNSSIPEVTGSDGASLLPDLKKELWVKEILELLTRPERRLELAKAGSKRRALFSWKKTAELTAAAYQEFTKKAPIS